MLWIFILLALGVRTTLWHLQCWQLREYRLDRLKAWLNTKDGKVFWYPWIKPGRLPRPKISGRVLMIVMILGVFNLGLLLITYHLLHTTYYLPLVALLWERTLWLQVGISVLLSGIPARWKKQKLFRQAAQIVNTNPDIIRIGITGSYGKSSTKEILIHLLQDYFGNENVLYNPANHNNEVAIARLIIDNPDFFKPGKKKKILAIETGAYKKGEIATVCRFIKPHIGILTGLNQQHLELFGSQQNIADAKFELPAAVSQKVFFNANNDLLVQLFADREISATKIPVSTTELSTEQDRSHFTAYGQNFTLPWPGAFFVENALLSLECARELGVSPEKLSKSLKTLPPLERALSLEIHDQGFTVLKDTYSSNVDGVLQAVAHLKNFSGKRVFVGMPLRELGSTAVSAHEQIFMALKEAGADIYWAKSDFADLGKTILGDKFHLLTKEYSELNPVIKSLGENDVILLESKLPEAVIKKLS